MKKEVIIVFLICIFLLGFVSADTTFFEGDYDYRDDFIMGKIVSEEIIEEATEVEEVDDAFQGGGRNVVSLQLNKELVCEICSDSLKQHIKKYQHINYSREQLEFLKIQIEEETSISFSHEQVAVLVENFEDECNQPYPLLGGLAAGRYQNLLNPLVILTSAIILISLVVLYILFGKLTKQKRRKTKKKK